MLECAPAGELVHRREPGGRDPYRGHARADADEQPERICRILGQNGLREVLPRSRRAGGEQVEEDTRDRQRAQCADQRCNRGKPPEIHVFV